MTKMPNCFNNIYCNDIYLLLKKTNSNVSKINFFDKLVSIIILVLSMLISTLLILVNLPFHKEFDKFERLAFARVDRVKNKINKLDNELFFISDDIRKFDFSLFRVVKRNKMLLFILTEFIKLCIDDYKLVLSNLNSTGILSDNKKTLKMISFRIPHTVFYKFVLNQILYEYKGRTIYTGQMYDRFAFVEEDLCIYYEKKLVCIPHGVETTLKMPRQYVGDIFYCTSKYMENRLKSIYHSDKYRYDEGIIEKIYKTKNIESTKIKKVVFFTQPLEIDLTKKIIENLNNSLKERKISLKIKLHPLENKSKYKLLGIDFIEQFDQAIQNSICISLSSTCLLEALYNESVSISIIKILKEDIEMDKQYDFLNDERILKPKTIDELVDIIILNLNETNY